MSEIFLRSISSEELIKQLTEAVKKEVISNLEVQDKTEEKEEETFLTQDEASKFLKCSTVKLWRLRKEGLLISYRSGRRILYKKTDLESYLLGKEGKNDQCI